jgi:hypothetical protein
MQKYIGDILAGVRRDTHNVTFIDDGESREGINDEDLLRWANWAQERAQGRIAKVYPALFEEQEDVDVVAGQYQYQVSDNLYLGTRLVLVEYSHGGDELGFYRLRPLNRHSAARSANGLPRGYYRSNNDICLVPKPQSSGAVLRVTYERRLDAIDFRRALIQGVTVAAGQLTALSLDPAADYFSTTALSTAKYLCVSDADGNVKMRNIPISSVDTTTGIVTLDPFTYADGEDIDAEDYVTIGKYTTTHSPLVDDFARYLSEYVARRVLFKDSSADAFDVGTEFIDMEQELIDSMKVPDKDLRELEQNDLDPMLYGTDYDIN